MNRLPIAGLVVVVALAALPVPADAFTGRRGTRVNPVNDSVFEVIARTAGGGADYWCGAADYARRALRAPWSATIHVARGRGPSVTTARRSAVQFTLNPPAGGDVASGPHRSLNDLPVGDSMSVQQANSHCPMQPVRP